MLARLKSTTSIRVLLGFLLAFGSASGWLGAAPGGFRITQADLTLDGYPRITFETPSNSYYILLRSTRANNGFVPARITLSAAAATTLVDTAARGQTLFYTIRQVPVSVPLDTDQDGIDDVYELNRAEFLNPLLNSDGAEDFDGDGVSNLDEYRVGSDPASGLFISYTTFISSPDNGESGVSVNRETVLLFDRPLDSTVTLGTNQFYTTVGGRRILSRMELASDRRRASLFYQEPLPASSRVKVTFDGTGIIDNTGHVLDADHDGKPGGIAVIEFDTASITPIPATAVIGHVFASELAPGADTGTNAINRPLAGVIITVDGSEQDLRAVTGVDGSFVLSPAPAGEFFVHVDGRTAVGSDYPDGDYYPRIGKKWDARAGIATNLAGGDGRIFLPLIKSGTLQAVSPVADTTITFKPEVVQANPALDGVRITVPANSLFGETGVRGGEVGIAPVPPDRLPEALPDRLNFPLVITVQTDGPENFDRPVPVQFPNLPDRKTGELLPPGAKTALWSFNHDMGNWEVVGSMTISADGKFAVTDPGVGIRAPGWHGTDPGSGGGCDKPRGGGTSGGGSTGGSNGGTDGGTDGGTTGGPEEPIPGDEPPGGDGPDGPDSDTGGGPGGGSSGGTGGGTGGGGGGCEAGDCGCDQTGAFAKPEETEQPRVVLDPGDPLRGSSPNNLYRVRAFNTSSGVTLEVTKTAGGAPVLLVGPLPMEIWGFSPDDHRFVYTFKDGAGNTSVWLHDLQNPTSGGPSAPFVPSWRRTVSASTYSVGFSPHGNYLLFVYNLRSNNRHVALAVARAQGGVAYETEYDINALGTTGDSENAAGWGWGPECDDRSLVYAFVGTPNSTTVRLVNLKLGNPVFDRNYNVGEGEWSFSQCGDVFGLWHFGALLGPGQAVLVKTKDGAVLSDVQNIPGGPVTFTTTSTRHVVNIAGNPTEFPNDAAQPCPIAPPPVPPQSAPELPVSTGLHYYALKDLNTGQMIERGIAGSAGVVHNRLILGVNRPYRSYVIKAETMQLGWSDFISGNNGQHLRLPDVILRPDQSPDADNDGLHDLGESIMGTNPALADTDNDGISDSAEVINGSDPSSGLAVATGVIGAAPTTGPAVDIVALNGLAAVATRDAGVALFNVFNGLAPTLVAQVNTPGSARGVAISGALIAVADDATGLVVIDAAQPSSAAILRQVPLGAAAQAVAAAAGVAYVGLVNGDVVAVDMPTGTILGRVRASNSAIQDVALGQETLYALSVGNLHVLDLEDPDLAVLKTVTSPGGVGAGARRLRLFVGSDRAYAVFTSGFNTFDLTDPRNPVRVKDNNTTSLGWKHIVANGSGSALAAVGRNSTDDGPHDVSLYDLGPARSDANVQGTFETPGLATAISIYNGILYVADGGAGLTVINYLAYDQSGQPPIITLNASFPLSPAMVEEGKLVRVTANVSDDVQVRNVEFYIDDILVGADGNFPFEARFVSPVRTAQKNSFVLKAKATDTGGNFTWTSPLTVALVPDATAPRIKKVFPGPADVISSASEVSIYFSEPMDTALLNSTTLRMTYAGADYLLGTTDDATLNYALDYRGDLNAASLQFPAALVPGFYRLQINGVKDLAGNSATPLDNMFWVLPDGPEGDPDKDDLINSDEILYRTNPLVADTDGDGWIDGLEVADRRNPLDPASFLQVMHIAAPVVGVLLAPIDEVFDPARTRWVARPQVAVDFQSVDENTISTFVLARPHVTIDLIPPDENLASVQKIIVANPPAQVLFPSVDSQLQENTVRVATPSVSVRFASPLQQALKSNNSPNL